MSFTRKLVFTPAFDKRDPDPEKNYGIHGVTLTFLLTGEKGVIQFVVYTNWQLPHVQKEFEYRERKGEKLPMALFEPMPADIGYHSPVPMYEGHRSMGECERLGGRHCYYDGSTLNAAPIFEALLMDGEEAVWNNLERWYRNTFGEETFESTT